MTIFHRCAIQILGLLVVAGGRGLWAGVDDPAGPPGSAETRMKTLNQIEPRTVITALPFVITNQGSYYLAGNLTGAVGTVGITIAAHDVDLDLRGFALVGVSNSLTGVWVQERPNFFVPRFGNVRIRNGVVTGWGLNGVSGTNGIDSKVSGIIANRNGHIDKSAGIAVGESWQVNECSLFENEGDGLMVLGMNGVIKDSVARWNRKDGISAGWSAKVVNCGSYWNLSNGVSMFAKSTVRDCTVLGNTGNGIQGAEDCRITGNQCMQNGGSEGAGIYVFSGSRVEDNHVIDNGCGILMCSTGTCNLVIRNSARNNWLGNYSVNTTNNVIGEIITNDLPGALTNANPWLNFSL